MTAKELDALKGVDVRTVDRAELVDIREVPARKQWHDYLSAPLSSKRFNTSRQ